MAAAGPRGWVLALLVAQVSARGEGAGDGRGRPATRLAGSPSCPGCSASRQVSGEFGVARVFPEKGGGGGGGGGKDYCILFNSQWAHLPHDLAKAVSASRPVGGGARGGLRGAG